MDNGTPETKPQLYRAGGKLTSVLPGDPSLTLIEAGDPFGLLLADSCFDSMMGQRLHLEDVLWVRWGLGVASAGGRSRPRQLGLRSFPRIDIFRHVEGVFVAQDPGSECYLPNPSGEAYYVAFLTLEQHQSLRKEAEAGELQQLLGEVAPVMGDLPGVTCDGTSIRTPSQYARGKSVQLDHAMLEV